MKKIITQTVVFLLLFIAFSEKSNAQLVIVKNQANANFVYKSTQNGVKISSFVIMNQDTVDHQINDLNFEVQESGFSWQRIGPVQFICNNVQTGNTAVVINGSVTIYSVEITIPAGQLRTINVITDLNLENEVNGPVMPKSGDYFTVVLKKISETNLSTNTKVINTVSVNLQKVYYNGITNAVSSIKNQTVKVYPNPFKDQINVDSKEGSKIVLNDILGNKVLEVSIENSNGTINTDFIPSGIYFLQILKDNQLIGYQKVVKE